MLPLLVACLLLACSAQGYAPVDRRGNMLLTGERRSLQQGDNAGSDNGVVLVSETEVQWKDGSQAEGRRVSMPAETGPSAIPIPATSKTCPPAPVEYRLRKNVAASPEAEILKTVVATTLASLAAECQNTPFCTAFDTLGNLWTNLKDDESLIKVAAKNPCYGLYFPKAPKQWLGLGAAWEPALRAARQQGAEYVQQQTDFQDQVDTVRAVLNQPEHSNLTQAETLNLVTEVLAFTNDLNKRRRLLQATNQTDTKAAVDKLVKAASAPAVWDPRDPSTTGGASYHCPVVSQGSCGSCQAFSAVGAAEVAVGLARGQKCPVQLSQQWMFFCNGLYAPTCNTGWKPTEAADVLKRVGVRSAACFPYTGSSRCTSLCSGTNGGALPGTFATTLFGTSQIEAAKQFLREKGAIYSFLDVYSDFESYRSGIYEHVSGKYQGGHSMLVVGYDDNKRAWIVRNSWGTGWGVQGFVLLSYNDPIFMKGTYYNIVGVSYSESGSNPLPTQTNPPPARKPVASPPPAKQTPATAPPPGRQAASPPPSQTNTGSLLCSVTFYSNEGFSGLGLQLKWSRPMVINQAGCTYMSDFSRTQPTFAYLPTSMKIQCTCSGTTTQAGCYALAQNVRLFGYSQSFTYYKAAGILYPAYSYTSFLSRDCTATGCSYSETPLAKDWYRKLNAAGLCFNMNAFGPAYV